jgi:uncharacterized protein
MYISAKLSFIVIAILRILAGLAVIYFVVAAYLYLYQDDFLFIRQDISGQRAAKMSAEPGVEEITIQTMDGISLHGWLVADKGSDSDDGKRKTVIYFGGNAEEVSHMVDHARRLGSWSFVLVNYRGYGLSEGSPSEENIWADALRIYDELEERGMIDPAHTIVMGRSIGTGTAVYLAANREIQGAVLISPYDSMVNVARDAYPFLPVGLFMKNRFDAVTYAPHMEIPLYAMVALEDRVIRPDRSRALIDQWNGDVTLIEIKNADHHNYVQTEAYWEFLRQSLKELEKQGGE